MLSILWFSVAAVLEIAGCYWFWFWLRLDRHVLWTVPGVVSLALFAAALTKAEPVFAGRTYAAYGGIYIIASLGWLVLVENQRPLPSDAIGALLCLTGTVVILLGAST